PALNGAAPEPPAWSRRRWAGVVLAILGLHLGALLLASPRQAAAPRRPESRAAVRWLTSPDLTRKTLDARLLNDPTLLAMASPRGFSGAAWLRPQPPAYRVSEWTDAERSLAQPTNSLGGAFQPLAAGSHALVFDPARKPAAPAPVASVAQPALRNASRLRIEGPAGARAVVTVPALRSWPVPDVLADSRVQIFINAEGLTFSPRLVTGGGRNPAQHAADQHALELARSIRFTPMPAATGSRSLAFVEGTLVFEWHTSEQPAPTAKP
ncbi:MAG: hypothetical protein ACKODH_01735, partial [Limisphaerales bacterium]